MANYGKQWHDFAVLMKVVRTKRLDIHGPSSVSVVVAEVPADIASGLGEGSILGLGEGHIAVGRIAGAGRRSYAIVSLCSVRLDILERHGS